MVLGFMRGEINEIWINRNVSFNLMLEKKTK